MPSKKGAIQALRVELMNAESDEDNRTEPDAALKSRDEVLEDGQQSTPNIFDIKGTSPSALKLGDNYVLVNPEDLKIGKRSLAILNQVPHFKGINSRIPEFYAIESKNRTQVSLVPHLRAITMLIHSYMATKIYSNNISIEVVSMIFSNMFDTLLFRV
jgi:hypothetical protein